MKAICPRCKYEFNSSVLFIDMDDKPVVVGVEYTLELSVEAINSGSIVWFLFAVGQIAAFKSCTDNDGGCAFIRFDCDSETGFAILPVRRKEVG